MIGYRKRGDFFHCETGWVPILAGKELSSGKIREEQQNLNASASYVPVY